ncbi:hypothetical protein ACLOJK_028453 [Asimina triloba]
MKVTVEVFPGGDVYQMEVGNNEKVKHLKRKINLRNSSLQIKDMVLTIKHKEGVLHDEQLLSQCGGYQTISPDFHRQLFDKRPHPPAVWKKILNFALDKKS